MPALRSLLLLLTLRDGTGLLALPPAAQRLSVAQRTGSLAPNAQAHRTHLMGRARPCIARPGLAGPRMQNDEEIAEIEAEEAKAAELARELATAEKRMHQRHEERVRRAEEREAKEDPAEHARDPATGFGSWSRSRIASFFHLFAR